MIFPDLPQEIKWKILLFTGDPLSLRRMKTIGLYQDWGMSFICVG